MQNRRRNSYIETSYTGVGAFSSAPAPNSSALAAASVIGSALKANNHNPVGLNLPKVQSKSSRTGSISRYSNTRTSSINTNTSANPIRTNSINTASARRQSLTSIPKQRLSTQKSVPNLSSRRSVSDFSYSSNNNNFNNNQHKTQIVINKKIPKTIKKYVPSANGLVAIEVPNPKHPDNINSRQQRNSYSRSNSFNVRSNSIPNAVSYTPIKDNNRTLSQRNKVNGMIINNNNKKGVKNMKRETKVLPNGTRVISTTVEEYGDFYDDDEFDDAYEDFDDFHRPIVDMNINHNLNDDNIDIPEHDINYYSNQNQSQNKIKNKKQKYITEDFDESINNSVSHSLSHPIIEENLKDEPELDLYTEPVVDDVKIPTPKHEIIDQIPKALHKSDSTDTIDTIEVSGNAPVNGQNNPTEQEIIDEIEVEEEYEKHAKDIIAENELVEFSERQKAFTSTDEPIIDPVTIEDLNSKHIATDSFDVESDEFDQIDNLEPVAEESINEGEYETEIVENPEALAPVVEDVSYAEEIDEEPSFVHHDAHNVEQTLDDNINYERAIKNKVPATEEPFMTNNNTQTFIQGLTGLNITSNLEHGGLLSVGLVGKSSNNVQDSEIIEEDKEIDETDEIDETGVSDHDKQNFVKPLENMTDHEVKEVIDNDQINDEGDYVDELNEQVDDINIENKNGNISATNMQNAYSEKEILEAQRKLDELVKQKEQEILDELLYKKQIGAVPDFDQSPKKANVSLGSQDISEFNKEIDTSVSATPKRTPNSLSKVTTTVTEGSDADLILHRHSEGLSEQPSLVVIPQKLSELPKKESEEFFTPVATPIQEVSAENFTKFSKSESPESSMIKNSEYPTPMQNSGSENKSMAQHLRPMINNKSPAILNIPQDADQDQVLDTANELDHLEIPKREPSIQAQIDKVERERSLSTPTSGNFSFTNSAENLVNVENNANVPVNKAADVNKRKSVLKKNNVNSSIKRQSLYQSGNQKKASSDAYLSLATAQNTRMNSNSALLPNQGQNSNRIQNASTFQDTNANRSTRSRSGSSSSNVANNANVNYTPLAAAAKAAQRHSALPGSISYGAGSGFDQIDKKYKRNSTAGFENGLGSANGVKAPNPKVEEAKKRILQNRPGSKRAKELYELSKTRVPVKADDLKALDEDTFLRRSSYEKTPNEVKTELKETNGAKKGKMTSMSLRNLSGLNFEEYEKKPTSRNYKSRFADDHSDTDLPLPPLEKPHNSPVTYIKTEAPIQQGYIEGPNVITETPKHNKKPAFNFKLLNKKKSRTNLATTEAPVDVPTQNKVSSPHKESKFERFFSEQHGPSSKRNFSSASTATNATGESVATDGGKKKGSRLKRLFG